MNAQLPFLTKERLDEELVCAATLKSEHNVSKNAKHNKDQSVGSRATSCTVIAAEEQPTDQSPSILRRASKDGTSTRTRKQCRRVMWKDLLRIPRRDE